jgi:hypothetical protein
MAAVQRRRGAHHFEVIRKQKGGTVRSRPFVFFGQGVSDCTNTLAERKGFEPPGLLALSLSRRVHLSALPPFRSTGYRDQARRKTRQGMA